MCLKDDDVVSYDSHQHDEHLQLVVDPQEHRAGDQAQDAAVDEVLGEERQSHNPDKQLVILVMNMLHATQQGY